MFFSTAAVVCALSLLSSTHALALVSRQSDCGFVCPEVDTDGNGLSSFVQLGDTSFSCTFSGAFESPCAYDSSTGALVGDDPDSRCPQQAISQCPTRRRRDNNDDSDSSTDWEPTPTWSGSPWSKPTQPWSKPPRSWSKPGPSPSPWTPKPQPPKKQPCNYTCPQKDLAKNGLTDEAIRGRYLFCRYPSPPCESCGFCKYSTKTGLLLEDNDEGNCPKTAPLALPWDRRND